MATLKISDLSVGDWVEYEGLHYPITFVGYGEGGDGSLVNLIRPDLSCFICKISDIRPIPITAEILEQNGFAPDEYSNKIWSFIAERELIQYFFVNHKLCIRNRNNTVDVDVLHIHQLQRALSLANIDKEITL